MRVIKQRAGYDCGICCLAMLLHKSYEWVLRRAPEYRDEIKRRGDDHDGLSNTEETLILSQSGLDPFRVRHWQIKSGQLGLLIKGRHAILTVPSLNECGSRHGIYWDGQKIFDPSRDRKYHGAVTEYEEVCLVNERKLLLWRMKNGDF